MKLACETELAIFNKVVDLFQLKHWGNVMATLTTAQKMLEFIQHKIAETHAAGDSILTLLQMPEIATSLQVLEIEQNNLVKPVAEAANDDHIITGQPTPNNKHIKRVPKNLEA